MIKLYFPTCPKLRFCNKKAFKLHWSHRRSTSKPISEALTNGWSWASSTDLGQITRGVLRYRKLLRNVVVVWTQDMFGNIKITSKAATSINWRNSGKCRTPDLGFFAGPKCQGKGHENSARSKSIKNDGKVPAWTVFILEGNPAYLILWANSSASHWPPLLLFN